jgi:hypothetical protein
MAGIHQISSSLFIQSGSVAEFKNGINLIGTLSSSGNITADNFNGMSTTGGDVLPTLNVGKGNDDGTFEGWVTTINTPTRITASGNFDTFCFIKNLDSVIEGSITEGLGTPNPTPEILINNWEVSNFPGILYSTYAQDTAVLSNGNTDYSTTETIVFSSGIGPSSPTLTIGLGEEKIIHRYSMGQGHSSNNHNAQAWDFEGSLDNITWTLLHTNDTLVSSYEYDSIAYTSSFNTEPYQYYRFKFGITNGNTVDDNFQSLYFALTELQLYNTPIELSTTSGTSNLNVWRTQEKGTSNGLDKQSHITETYPSPGVYEYLIIASNKTSNQTVVKGTSVKVN